MSHVGLWYYLISFSGPKPMQDSWGNGGEEMGMSTSQWDTEDGDMWNSPTSQESSSSCNSWGNGPKKGPSKVREHTWLLHTLADEICSHLKTFFEIFCSCIFRGRLSTSQMRLGSWIVSSNSSLTWAFRYVAIYFIRSLHNETLF